jgi:ketosteroid isomerase-like protein
MVGKEAIRQGIAWGLSSLEKPGFKVRRIWQDAHSGVAETDTHHIIKGGMQSKFDQVFVFEVRGGKFTRLQSYVPYPPHGTAGMIGNVTKVIWRLQGKMK